LVFLAWGEVYSLFSATSGDAFGTKNIGSIYVVLYCAKGIAALLGADRQPDHRGDRHVVHSPVYGCGDGHRGRSMRTRRAQAGPQASPGGIEMRAPSLTPAQIVRRRARREPTSVPARTRKNTCPLRCGDFKPQGPHSRPQTQRADLIRRLLAPQQSPEVLRRDRTLGQGATASRPLGMAYIDTSTLPPQQP
jgi:hypothetical protein